MLPGSQSRQAFFGIEATDRAGLFDETHLAPLEDGLIIKHVVSATKREFEILTAPVLKPMILN